MNVWSSRIIYFRVRLFPDCSVNPQVLSGSDFDEMRTFLYLPNSNNLLKSEQPVLSFSPERDLHYSHLKIFLIVEIVSWSKTVSLVSSHLGNIFFEVSRRQRCGMVQEKISLPAEIFARLQNLLHPSHTSPCFSSDVPDNSEATSVFIFSMEVVFSILVQVLICLGVPNWLSGWSVWLLISGLWLWAPHWVWRLL